MVYSIITTVDNIFILHHTWLVSLTYMLAELFSFSLLLGHLIRLVTLEPTVRELDLSSLVLALVCSVPGVSVVSSWSVS